MTTPRFLNATIGDLVFWLIVFWLGIVVHTVATLGATMVWIALFGGPVIALLIFREVILVFLINVFRNRIELPEPEPKEDLKPRMTMVNRGMPLCAVTLGLFFPLILDQHT